MRVLGLMSGSSLDGLDIALCDLNFSDEKLHWSIEKSCCVTYSSEWIERLKSARKLNAQDLLRLHCDYGKEVARLVLQNCDDWPKAELVGWHGHTIYHTPDQGWTFQLGHGAALASHLSIDVACDFRANDMIFGGIGTPLAPLVDSLAFSEYDAWLNIGGIANISVRNSDGIMIATDISPANQTLNAIAQQLDLEYDLDGQLASQGNIDSALLQSLLDIMNSLKPYPIGLDNHQVNSLFTQSVLDYQASERDKMATVCEFIALEVKAALENLSELKNGSILITGGGAYHRHLVDRIRYQNSYWKIVIPDSTIIEYKEALLMAVCAYCRIQKQPVSFGSVTQSQRDVVGGALYSGLSWPS